MKKKRKNQRFVALLLSICMLSTGNPSYAWAENFSDGEVSTDIEEESEAEEIKTEEVPIDEEETSNEEFTSDETLSTEEEFDTENEFSDGEIDVNTERTGICGNGTKDINIDINSEPYTSFASFNGGENAYKEQGDAWFASARVNQLTGKGNEIFNSYDWYNTQAANYGFEIGDIPKAKSLACFYTDNETMHIAVVEAVDGECIVISEGGMPEYSDEEHGYCVIRTISQKELESGYGKGDFLGYVYLDNTDEDQIKKFDDEEEITIEAESEEQEKVSGQISDIELYATPSQLGVDEETFQSFEAAALKVRKAFLEGDDICTVTVKTSEHYEKDEIVDKLLKIVYEHTGNPKEGDALYMRRETTGYSVSYEIVNKVYQYQISINQVSFTTVEQEKELDKAVSELLDQLALEGKNKREKIAIIYDYICQNVRYAYVDTSEDKLPFTAYGALINKYATCQGYALLLYRLALEAGIDTRYIRGKALGGEHAWNIVQLDDGLYYNLDATWDEAKEEYQYFLCSEEAFSDHIRNPEYLTAEFKKNYPMYSTGVSADGWEYCENEDGTITLTKTSDILSDIVTVPSIINGKVVSGLGNNLFANNNLITGIVLPVTIKQIEKDVFSECQKLKAIVFEGNAPNIDVNAFGSKISICYPYNDNTWNNDIIKKYGNEVKWMPYEISDIDKNILWILSNTGDLSVYGCGDMPAYSSDNYPSWYMYRKQIISVEVCDGITSILGAFYRCENMKEIDLPESIINIGNQSFARCYSLKNVIIPNKVQNIGSYVFEDCEKLEGIVNIPASVEYIGRGIFEGCSFIEEITVDENNKHYRSIDGGLYNINCTELLAWAGGKEGVARVVDTVKVIGASSFSGCTKLTEISLPESIETIENEAFYNCKNIVSMKLPDKVKSIDAFTFGECSKLEKIYIPNGVTSIGEGAFRACSNIEEIILPENLKELGNSVFYECTSLKMCNVPEGTEIIDEWAFTRCINLENIYIPETITEIGQFAFADCESLTEMIIPSKVTQISYMTFNDCSNLEKIKIKGQIKDIGDYAFAGCCSLTDVKLPSSVENIGKRAFACCENVISMLIPDSLITLGDSAFSGCSNLSYIFFRGDFPDIGNDAFYNVVADCYYPQNSSTWTEDALQNYSGVVTWTKWNKYGSSGTDQYWGEIDEGKLFLFGNGEMYDFSSGKSPWTDWSLDIEEVLFAVDISNISNNAFTGCSNLNKITFLGEAPQIAENAFEGITADAYYPISDTWTEEKLQNYGGVLSWKRAAIAEGKCGEDVKWLFYHTGILYIYGDGKMSDYTSELDIPWSKYRLKIKKVIIEDGVSNIGAHAFERCLKKNVVLPNSIREIGESAFTCYEGDELIIPEGVKKIGNYAFTRSNLTKITIPSSVEEMGIGAFTGCQLLKTAGPIGGGYNIEYGWKDRIPDGIFWGTADLKELVISDSIKSIGDLFDHNGSTIEKILVDKDNKYFSSDEFGVLFNKNKTELLKIPFGLINEVYSIPDSVTSIKSYAVQCCYNLKKIIIPDSVMTIPYGAFMYCENVESVTIGKRCDFFDVSAFPALKEIIISEDNPYYSCDAGCILYNKDRSKILKMLKNYEGEYEIPDMVITISINAFRGCDKISTISIPDSVTKIEYGAFGECVGLNNVIFKGGAPSIEACIFDGVTATVQYPQESSSWTENMFQNYGGTLTWEPYHSCDYTFEVKNRVEASCTRNGYTGDKYCKVCGNEESGEEIPATGHSEEVLEGKAPTCTESGLTEGKHCSVCGEVLEVQEEIPATGHSEEIDEGRAATCTETGLTEGKYCSVCGEVLEAQEEIPATGHSEEVDEGRAATCTETGLTEGKHCSVCGEVLEAQEEIPSTGHSEEIDEGRAATCTETGLTEGKHCSVCGEVLEVQEEIPATGHTEEVLEGKAATCTESGLTEGKHCSVCGEVLEAQEEIPATGHAVEVDEGKAATCTESGLTEGKHCSVCGEVLEAQKEIPATGHTEETDEGRAATCTEPGLTEGKHCSVCGEVLEEQEEIPATGHAVEVDEGKAATCTESGLTEGKHCSVCGEVLEAQKEIPATGHTEETDEGRAATCTEPGLTEGKHCSVCGEVLEEQEEIPATGHSEEVDERRAATCTEPGLTEGKHCSACGEVLEAQKEVPALGHSEEVDEGRAATCTEPGLTEGKHCSVCGEVLEEQEEIPATGHTEETDEGKAVTCTESGLTEGKHCSVCGEILEAQEEIPATGHVVEVLEGKAATCTESGLTEGEHCSVCGEVLEAQKEIPATGHTEETDEGKAATCTETGLTEGRHCSVCGEVLEAQEEIPATGHVVEVDEGKAATCTESGLTEGKHCSVCGEVLEVQKEIPATGHTEETDEGKAATCTETGLTEGRHCSVCGEVLEAQEEIPPTGHTEEIDEGKAPTCTETGLTEGKHCSVCGEVLEAQKEIPALGHTEEVDEGKAPTCTESGLTEGKHCSVCGEVLETQKEIPATGHSEEVQEGKAPTCTENGLTEGKHCSVCGEVLEAQKEILATGHTDGEWTITKEATAVSEGQQELRCTVCGNVIRTENIAKLKATIKLNVPKTLPLKEKQTFQIKVSGLAKGDKVSSWKSSNTKVVTVTSSGKITGKKSGTATITVKLRSGLTSQVKVKVQKTDVAATSITVLNKATNKKITGTTTLKVRKKLTLAVTLAPVTCKQKVTYTSSNKKVAAVTSKGVITALKKGTATITVKAGKKTAKIKIKVN